LVTDRDDVEYTFHVANNAGASSSMLELTDQSTKRLTRALNAHDETRRTISFS
jgi:hypothetical protein